MIVLCHSPVEAADAVGVRRSLRLPANVTARWQRNERREERGRDRADEARCERVRSTSRDRRPALPHRSTTSRRRRRPPPGASTADSEDPLTGEKVVGEHQRVDAVNDIFSQGVVDQARYIKGELEDQRRSPRATYIRDWAAGRRGRVAGAERSPRLTQAQLNQQIGNRSAGRWTSLAVSEGSRPARGGARRSSEGSGGSRSRGAGTSRRTPTAPSSMRRRSTRRAARRAVGTELRGQAHDASDHAARRRRGHAADRRRDELRLAAPGGEPERCSADREHEGARARRARRLRHVIGQRRGAARDRPPGGRPRAEVRGKLNPLRRGGRRSSLRAEAHAEATSRSAQHLRHHPRDGPLHRACATTS